MYVLLKLRPQRQRAVLYALFFQHKTYDGGSRIVCGQQQLVQDCIAIRILAKYSFDLIEDGIRHERLVSTLSISLKQGANRLLRRLLFKRHRASLRDCPFNIGGIKGLTHSEHVHDCLTVLLQPRWQLEEVRHEVSAAAPALCDAQWSDEAEAIFEPHTRSDSHPLKVRRIFVRGLLRLQAAHYTIQSLVELPHVHAELCMLRPIQIVHGDQCHGLKLCQ